MPAMPPAVSTPIQMGKGVTPSSIATSAATAAAATAAGKKDASDSMLTSIIDKVKHMRIAPSSVLDGKHARRPATEEAATTATTATGNVKPTTGGTVGKDGVKRYTAKSSRAAKHYDTQTGSSMARVRGTSSSSPKTEADDDATADNASESADSSVKHEQLRQILDRLREHADQTMDARAEIEYGEEAAAAAADEENKQKRDDDGNAHSVAAGQS
ncbi:hypothetical protein SYNPS1DRAFT_28971 [Syncephalis pseudoplumigaleata]|uniref:Uncharacterized protein n=1 Tax=Syncephalis pseudoplumigaleata TaxID=1712513 RepID=A0A4P9YYZ4_9FUNG|nr:hypothetical protein SYNPS1DRAFT_28971 [Syncephalis pseudoplumigaleata]|eukprot:RKP25294.1 hypothetical protein SYNPS1DRAFT_28971 [Syncephalis pseudoplumigaleata]